MFDLISTLVDRIGGCSSQYERSRLRARAFGILLDMDAAVVVRI
jgi:hypothetical protein